MQKLYTANELAKDSGMTKTTIKLWASRGWAKPCRMTANDGPHVLMFTQAEHDRVVEAVRAAEYHPRKVGLYLNRTLYAARECNALTCTELASRCDCCKATVRKALDRLGYPRWHAIGVLEEDVGEVKALVQKFREEGVQKREAARVAFRNGQESTGGITLNISLDRKSAEALAEEILAQI